MSTIFAPITASGGAVTIVRISGKDAFCCLTRFGIAQQPRDRECVFHKIYDGESLLDEAMFVCFVSPKSFTGDDVVEFFLHGSQHVVSRFLLILAQIPGFRFAENGEFTKMAFLNGKIDLIQAEGINNLIQSENREQHKLAMEMLSGKNSKVYQKMRQLAIDVLSELEVNIDFPEDDIKPTDIRQIESRVMQIKNSLDQLIAKNRIGETVFSGIKITLIGNVNAGKSSLLNTIVDRKAAIVSNIPGTTRDAIEIEMTIDGMKVKICDTAGIRETQCQIEQEGVNIAKQKANESNFNIHVIDSSEQHDEIIISNINANDIIVIGKIDLLNSANEVIQRWKDKYPENIVEGVSALKNIGIDTLLSVISKTIKQNFLHEDGLIKFNEKQLASIYAARNTLSSFSFTQPIEILVENMRIVCNEMNYIIGNVINDDILDNIFSRFCIGK